MVAIFALLIIGKVFQIQFVEGEKWREIAERTNLRYAEVDAVRGDIYSSNGKLIATSVPVYEIRMDASSYVIPDELFYSKIDSLAGELSNLFKDRTAAQYRRSIINARNNQERYFLIKRNVSYNELNQLKNFPLFRKGRFGGGLIVEKSTRREMPFRSLAARTIGYERGGYYVGLEGAYSEHLEGIKGKRLMQRTTGGTWIPIDDRSKINPRNGKDIYTTIDINIQDIVETNLRKQLHRFNADYGTVVVMEVSTGKIRAISNLTLSEDGFYRELFNYAVGESIEPGSTFKLASAMAAIEEGIVKPGDYINTGDGSINYADRIMRDSEEDGHGTITFKEAFALSSNVGISKIIYDNFRNEPQRFVDRIKSMNLDQRLGLEIAGEGSPVIKNTCSPDWSGVSLPWMSIGYEVSLTPLQILALYNAVANDGKMVKPLFVEEIRQTGRLIKKTKPEVINRKIASTTTIEIMQDMLIEAVKNGTASNINNKAYQIAGKTGTAQVADSKFGYHRDSGVNYRASFAGYFPADNPKYSMIVVIHNPKGWIYTGSQVAAPVFRTIADNLYARHIDLPAKEFKEPVLANLPSFPAGNYKDILKIYNQLGGYVIDNPTSSWITAVAHSDTVKLKEREYIQNLVPNVVGMSIKDALYILENAGMNVKFQGKGIVRRQSINPGVRIQNGQTIYLELT